LHDFRHDFANKLVRACAPVKTVSTTPEQANEGITPDLFTRPGSTDQVAAVAALDAALTRAEARDPDRDRSQEGPGERVAGA
jgi:hypothetical protein